MPNFTQNGSLITGCAANLQTTIRRQNPNSKSFHFFGWNLSRVSYSASVSDSLLWLDSDSAFPLLTHQSGFLTKTVTAHKWCGHASRIIQTWKQLFAQSCWKNPSCVSSTCLGNIWALPSSTGVVEPCRFENRLPSILPERKQPKSTLILQVWREK